MTNWTIKTRRGDFLFFDIALILYVIWGTLKDADIAIYNLFLFNFNYIAYLSVLFSLPCILKWYRISYVRLMILIFVISFAFYFKIYYNYSELLPLSFLIFAATDVPVYRIVKILLSSTFFSTLFICMLCFIDVLPDKVFVHTLDEFSTMDAHTLGFFYYSGFSYRAIVVLISYLYVNRHNFSLIKLLGALFFSFLAYFISSTRQQLIISLLFIFFVILSYNFRINIFMHKIWKYIGLIIYPLAFFSYLAIALSSAVSPDILDWWDKQFSGRMNQTILGFAQYNISLVGNKLEMVGSAAAETTIDEYFFIDAGYAYWLLAYGVLFTAFILLAYSVIVYKAFENRQRFVFFWLLFFAMSNMINDFFTLSYFCPTILFLFADFTREKHKTGVITSRVSV